MRATMGITWLLLSLSFLFHSVCSEESQTESSVSKTGMDGTAAPGGGDPSGTKPPTDSNAIAASTVLAPTTDDAGKNSGTILTPTPAKPTVVVTTADSLVATSSKSTDKPGPLQTQAAITEKPATPPITITNPAPTLKQDSSPADATTSQPQLPPAATSQLPPAATSASKGSSEVSTNTDTVHSSEPSGSTKASGTEVSSNMPANASNMKTTMIPNTPTGGAQGQQSPAHTTTASKTSQGDSEGGNQNKTGTVTSPARTASSAPSPAGNPGTTSTPSIPTNAGPPVTAPSDTKAGTTSLQTTPTPAKATTPTTTTTTASTTTIATTASPPKTFLYSLNNGHENKEEKELVEVCRWLLANYQDGSCSLMWRDSNGTKVFGDAEIKGKVKGDLVTKQYEDITKVKKPTDNKTLIAILASCGALLIMIVILAVCASHHRKPYNENQQHLTDELHTVENGYHDNPTLEVMEAQPEMQEKKMVLNGEFNDSWIVPMDNLLKEDTPDEEDTHL